MQNIVSIKAPLTDYSVHPLIASRWSPRAYDTKPVEREKLQRIFEAARWTASSNNLQPWYFMVGLKGDEVYQKIFDSLVEFNQMWSVNAPVLVLAIAKTTNAKGEPNNIFAYDLGQSVATLSLQAMEEGVYTHQMGGFDTSAATLALAIPEEYKILVVFTLGYLGNAGILHPNLQRLEMSPRSRRPVRESVFTGSFGHKADFL
ncbi:MAG: nitroreductase family protein [Bacteroidales bacterium]|nr:nitroreductase family protein [Bacteroidales bacterium]